MVEELIRSTGFYKNKTKSIIGMARGLRLRVLAEGVETERQLEFLREQGCEEVQGFLFGEPVPASAFQVATTERSQ